MIVRAGTPVSFPVLFSSGFPDGNVTWEIRDQDGDVLDDGTVAVPAQAVSVVVAVPGTATTLPNGVLLSARDICWTYTVNGIVIYHEERFSVEARLPYGVSANGVRAKLGVDKQDLPDQDIALVAAYYAFLGVVTQDALDLITDPSGQLAVTNSIEALAALALLPTMPVRVAAKESSGTNQYQRQKIDWDAVRLSLEAMVDAGYEIVVPGYDVTGAFGPLLIIATPEVDPLTGGAA